MNSPKFPGELKKLVGTEVVEIEAMAVNTTPQPNIEQARDLLSPYLDGEVTPEERLLVEEALAASPELRADLEDLRQTVALVATLPHVPAPRPFTLTEADAQRAKPAPRRGWFSLLALRPWVGGLAAMAAVLVCMLAVGGLLFRGVSTPGQPQQAAYAPAAEQAKATEAPKAEAQPVQKTVAVEKEVVPAPTAAVRATAVPAEPSPEAAKAAEKSAKKQVAVTATPAAASGAAANPAGQVGQGAAASAPLATSEITDTTPTTLAIVALPTELTEEPASSQTAATAANAAAVTAPAQPPIPEQFLDKSQPETAVPSSATPTPQRKISPTPQPSASPSGKTQPLPATVITPRAEITSPTETGWMTGLAVGVVVIAGLVGWALMRRGREKRQ